MSRNFVTIPAAAAVPLLYAGVFRSPLSVVAWWLRLSAQNFERLSIQVNGGSNSQVFRSMVSENPGVYINWETAVGGEKQKKLVSALGVQLQRVFVSKRSVFSFAEKQSIVQKKIAEAKFLLLLCKVLPWVKAVAVTGSLAAFDPKSEDDDLDLLIVCANKRLWLVRPILVLFSKLCGRRRSWNHEEPNSWCFNMWLEESSLQVGSLSRNYYVANEVCLARWLVTKDGIAERFLHENMWASAWLPKLYDLAKLQVSLVTAPAFALPAPPPFSWLFEACNFLAFRAQLAYMRSHKTSEKVTYNSALFHTSVRKTEKT